ncbi:MAG TPA: copper resistance protein B [Rudaea sp.]|nr:copper resistance protein B [Rudaea sp.]
MRGLAATTLLACASIARASDMSAMSDVMQMNDDAALGMVKFDELEHAFTSGDPVAWKGDAWYGGDFDKIWLRTEGGHEDGRLDTRNELSWDHAFSSFWDWQLGARRDSGLGGDRNWAAFGVRGLAPYWFDIEATAYAGEQGRTAFRLRTEYELLFTQRLILQPEFEMNLYGKSDPQREVGSGLSDAEFGVRLRYEIRREFAPYVGVVWQRKFGEAARIARIDGRDTNGTQLVAGIRFWF